MIEFFKSPLKFWESDKYTERKRNPSARAISCELEIAKADCDDGISSTVRKWHGSIVEDGSLPDGGFEVNTAPASGDVFCRQIEEIGMALSDSEAEVTPACGYHVHIDARDFRFFEVRRLILLYRHIEDALFAMQPASRHNSHYCERCGEYYDKNMKPGKECKRGVVLATYQDTSIAIKYRKKNKYDGSRYKALNLHSWFFRGTIECRLAAGSTRADKIIPWALLWAGILDYAYSHTEAEIAELCKARSGYKILLAICPTDEVREYVKERTKKFS